MVNCNFLPRPDGRKRSSNKQVVGKNGKCQGGVHFFINIFTITQELDAKCTMNA